MNKIVGVAGILILIGIAYVSCKNKLDSAKVVVEWNGKKLILPVDSLIRSSDSNNTKPLSKKVKILTTINASCGSCIGELKDWKDFMGNIDTSKVGFVFLFYSIDNLMSFEEVNRFDIKFSYPFFFDKGKVIITKNNIPDDKRRQTFLLDSMNSVVLVGNPIHNKEISQLYRNEIRRLSNSRVEKRPGVIITYEPDRVKLSFDNKVIFQDEEGKRLSKDEVKEMSKKYKCWLEQKSPRLVIVRKQVSNSDWD